MDSSKEKLRSQLNEIIRQARIALADIDVIDQPPPPSIAANEAEKYGVRVIDKSGTVPRWRVRRVRHLSGRENGGKHNIYVYAYDQKGMRVDAGKFRLGWTWEGRRPNEEAPPKRFDKPLDEAHANVDMYWGQKVAVWVEGQSIDSDVVEGMHTAHDDEAPGNSRGHHSFEVIFELFVPPGVEVK